MLLKQYASDNDTLVVGKIRVAGKRDLGLGAQEGGPPGGRTDQVVPGVATLEWIFLRTCLQWARGLLWGKVQPKGALPCHQPLISNDNTIKVNNIGQKSE